jgi:hypothetical protein
LSTALLLSTIQFQIFLPSTANGIVIQVSRSISHLFQYSEVKGLHLLQYNEEEGFTPPPIQRRGGVYTSSNTAERRVLHLLQYSEEEGLHLLQYSEEEGLPLLSMLLSLMLTGCTGLCE